MCAEQDDIRTRAVEVFSKTVAALDEDAGESLMASLRAATEDDDTTRAMVKALCKLRTAAAFQVFRDRNADRERDIKIFFGEEPEKDEDDLVDHTDYGLEQFLVEELQNYDQDELLRTVDAIGYDTAIRALLEADNADPDLIGKLGLAAVSGILSWPDTPWFKRDSYHNENQHLRAEFAAEALAAIGQAAVPQLIDVLQDSYIAGQALGRIGDPRAIEPLAELLNADSRDSSCGFSLRAGAAMALGRLQDARAIPVLVAILSEQLDDLDPSDYYYADSDRLNGYIDQEDVSEILRGFGPAAVPYLIEALPNEPWGYIADLLVELGHEVDQPDA
jgi:hypothetical protein